MTQPFWSGRTEAVVDTSLPVTGPSETQWRWIHRLQLPALLGGDVLHVCAEGQVANEAGVNVEIATQVTLVPGWPYYIEDLWGYNGAPGPSYMIGAINGEGVSTDRHYFQPSRTTQFVLPVTPMPTAWLNFRVRSRSSATPQGQCIIKGPGYGHLACSVFR